MALKNKPATKTAPPPRVAKPPASVEPPAPKALPAPVNTGAQQVARVGLVLSDEDILRDARSGMEGITKDDLAIPRMGILQSVSSQINPRDPAFIDGAQVGMICNPVTQELFDGEEGILVCFVQFNKSHLEFKPKRGGFVKNHGSNFDLAANTMWNDVTGGWFNKEGNEIIPSTEYFAFVIDPETGKHEQCVFSFMKTNMPEARRLATLASTYQVQLQSGRTVTPAIYYRLFRVTAVPKQNDKGTWFVWKVTPEGHTVDLLPETGQGLAIYNAASSFSSAVKAGNVKVHDPQNDSATSASGGGINESAPI